MDENHTQSAPTGQRPVHYSEFVNQLALQQARQVSTKRSKGRSAAGFLCAIALIALGAGLTVLAIGSLSPSGADRAASSEQPTSSTIMTVMTLDLTPGQASALGLPSVAPTVPVQTTPMSISVVTFDMPSIDEARSRCNEEHTAVFVGLQAFVMNTGAHPDSPDAISPHWIVAHPDGWDSRWAFDYSEQGIAVVPVAGGACDL